MNRTGVTMNPTLSRELIEGAKLTPVVGKFADYVAAQRAFGAETATIGSLPPAVGDVNLVLLDKMGERLAFERSGTRLYDALAVKLQARGDASDLPSLADVQKIRDEEHEHALMLQQSIEQLGGDPTILTPSANVNLAASLGLVQILTDPRTTVVQALHAILIAELADNAAWELLQELAEDAGEKELARKFAQALEEEGEHEANVSAWVRELVRVEAGFGT